MRTGTKNQIFEIIEKKGSARASELVTTLGISPQALHRHLRVLCEQGLLKRRGSPPTTRYELGATTGNNVRAENFSYVSEIKKVLGCHPAVRLVTLFGSVARGEATAKSDIDVLVFLSATERFDRNDIWNFWDRHTRELKWARTVSLVVKQLRPNLAMDTLLLDFPEEHVLIFDRGDIFQLLREKICEWREKNGSFKIPSFGGAHAWKYSSKAKSLDEINFELELGNVA